MKQMMFRSAEWPHSFFWICFDFDVKDSDTADKLARNQRARMKLDMFQDELVGHNTIVFLFFSSTNFHMNVCCLWSQMKLADETSKGSRGLETAEIRLVNLGWN